jgi:hypothetical protein
MAHSDGGRRRNRGCLACLGCLGLTACLAAVLVGVVLFAPTLLQKVGIFGPGPEERFSGAADPVGTQMVTEVLDDAGFEGVDVVVMPVQGSKGQIALFTLSESSRLGSIDSTASGEEQFLSLVQEFSRANREGDLKIETVALDFQGENGQSLVSAGVPQEAVDAYATGKIGRREFVQQVEIDFSNVISAAELQRLIAEMEAGQ